MSKKVKFLIFLLIGVVQTFILHVFNLHSDLPHMAYSHWLEYVFEALFYTAWWAGLYWFFFVYNMDDMERRQRYDELHLHKQRRKIR